MQNVFIWPEELSAGDAVIWGKLVEFIRIYMQYHVGLSNSGEALYSGYFAGNHSAGFPEYPDKLLQGVKPGTAFILKHGCPEFLLPALDSYLVGLDKFLGSAYQSGFPEWRPLFLKEICYNNQTDWNKIAQQLPHVSVVDSDRVAYWQTGAKMVDGVETRTTVGRYVGRQLGLEVDLEKLNNEFWMLTGVVGDDVNFIENNDLAGWDRVFSDRTTRSCMNSPNYNLDAWRVWQCYCTAAHGLGDNGLRLAYMESDGRIAARAIVHEPSKTYIKVYGDDRLAAGLKALGYSQTVSWPEGLILWSDKYESGWIHPYLDGDESCASFKDGVWVLDPSGKFNLGFVDGIIDIFSGNCWECDCRSNDLFDIVRPTGSMAQVCYDCLENHYVEVWDRGESIFMHYDDAVYLEYRDNYVFSETVVYFQGEPIYEEDLRPWTDDLGRKHYVPKPRLSDELDQLVSEFKQSINS